MFTFIFNGVASTIECFASSGFWASLTLTVSLCIPPCMGYRWFMQKTKPTLAQSIRRDAKRMSKRAMTRTDLLSRRRRTIASRSTLRRGSVRPATSRVPKRSAYAFSQEKGVGTLVLKRRLKARLGIIKSKVYDLEGWKPKVENVEEC